MGVDSKESRRWVKKNLCPWCKKGGSPKKCGFVVEQTVHGYRCRGYSSKYYDEKVDASFFKKEG